MNKAFVKETGDDEMPGLIPEMPSGVKNYITPSGYRRLEEELRQLLAARTAQSEFPAIDVVADEHAQAAGDQRNYDQRIHYLQARLESAEIVDPAMHIDNDRIFFGATVTYQHANGERQTVSIVGLDELDPSHGLISWLSPVAQTLLKASVGDTVKLKSPAGDEELTVLDVHYPQPAES